MRIRKPGFFSVSEQAGGCHILCLHEIHHKGKMAFAALEGMKAQGIPALFTEDTDFIGGASGNADIRIIPAGRSASDCREKQMGLLFRHAYDKDGTAAEGIAMGICGGDNKIHDFIILPHTKPVAFEKGMHYN